MKKASGILIFLLTLGQAFGASQVPDIGIFKKDSIQDSLSLFIFPLEDYLEKHADEDKLKGFNNCESPSCARGYQAVWLIENDSLFIHTIQGCNKQMSWCDESTIPDLKTIFGEDAPESRFFAHWVNGKYSFFEGEQIPLIDKFIFEDERLVKCKNGEVESIKHKKNVKKKQKTIGINNETPKFILYRIHNAFNWRGLPKLKKDKWYAELTITVKNNGKTAIQLLTDTPEDFRIAAEAEYLRCLKNLRWHKYKQQGKKVEVSFKVRAYFERHDQIITIIK